MWGKLIHQFKTLISFIKNDIWEVRARDYPPVKRLAIKSLKILLLTGRGFNEDRIPVRAAALTLYALLSIVPVAALAFGIAQGFGFENNLEKALMAQFPEQGRLIQKVIEFAESLLKNTRGGVVAGVGMAFLFYAVIRVLSNIEIAFNDIWGVTKPRSLARKFSDYLSLMLIVPVLIIMSSSLNVYLTTQIKQYSEYFGYFSFIDRLLLSFLSIGPYVIYSAAFTFLYVFMPNKSVTVKSALLGGVLAGVAYQLLQTAYVNAQVGVARYNAIYGSFAALPLFIIWLQISWFIILLGAKLSYVHQTYDGYENDTESVSISMHFSKIISLRIMHLVIRRFMEGQPAMDPTDLSKQLEIPIRVLREQVCKLENAGMLVEVQLDEESDPGYQPARDTSQLTVKTVLDALEQEGVNDFPLPDSPEQTSFANLVSRLRERMTTAEENVLLRDLNTTQFSGQKISQVNLK